jgi:uncharacterized damage-inducible protein DinB
MMTPAEPGEELGEEERMDVLDRLLGHDAWTTRQLLLRCRELSDEQMDRRFDIGDRSLRETFRHVIENMEVWTDLIAGRPVRSLPGGPYPVEGLLERLSSAAKELADVSRRVRDEGRLDQMVTDAGEEPAVARPLGGMIVHVITHSMHHRAQMLYLMEQLGLRDLPEGDALEWEHQAFGWRAGERA